MFAHTTSCALSRRNLFFGSAEGSFKSEQKFESWHGAPELVRVVGHVACGEADPEVFMRISADARVPGKDGVCRRFGRLAFDFAGCGAAPKEAGAHTGAGPCDEAFIEPRTTHVEARGVVRSE